IAGVSSMQDEVIRLFFSAGVKACANFETADPVMITMGQFLDPTVYYSATDYAAALQELRTTYAGTGRLATYFLGGMNVTFHQHIWRTRFTDPTAGTITIADFLSAFLAGDLRQIGP